MNTVGSRFGWKLGVAIVVLEAAAAVVACTVQPIGWQGAGRMQDLPMLETDAGGAMIDTGASSSSTTVTTSSTTASSTPTSTTNSTATGTATDAGDTSSSDESSSSSKESGKRDAAKD